MQGITTSSHPTVRFRTTLGLLAIAVLLLIPWPAAAAFPGTIGNILGKLELRDRAAAIVFAFDYGLVQPAP